MCPNTMLCQKKETVVYLKHSTYLICFLLKKQFLFFVYHILCYLNNTKRLDNETKTRNQRKGIY